MVTLENLWLPATSVQAQLSVQAGAVTITQGTATLASLASPSDAQLRFTVQVPTVMPSYTDALFTVALTAAGGYSATRSFPLEIAELQNGSRVTGELSKGLYDEFHTYHFDLTNRPPGHNRLRFITTSNRDIDLLVKQGSAPQYLITLAVNPDGDQIFSSDATIGGNEDGNESVCFAAVGGTYFATVVNYAQFPNTPYTLEAVTDAGGDCPIDGGNGGSGNSKGGGGSVPLTTVGLLLSLVWLRRRWAHSTRHPGSSGSGAGQILS